MRKLLVVLLLMLSASGIAQAVKSGEKFIYTASYSMGGLMTPLSQIRMQTETVKTSKSAFLHLICHATTFSKWDPFFKMRDTYESYVNPLTFKSSLYKRNILEGKFTKTEKYIFKNNGTIASTVQKKNELETKNNFRVGSATNDVVSVLYQMRNINFTNMKVGQIQNFNVVFDEKEMTVSAKYIGKETVNAGNLGKKLCYKISIASKTQALKGTDKNIIWLTADESKVPALIKFSIPVGTGQLTLMNASGL